MLPLRRVTRPPCKQRESPVEPRVQRLRIHELRAGRSQLDRQGKLVKLTADPIDSLTAVHEAADSLGSLDEQRGGRMSGERCERILVLARESEGSPTRDKQRRPRSDH